MTIPAFHAGGVSRLHFDPLPDGTDRSRRGADGLCGERDRLHHSLHQWFERALDGRLGLIGNWATQAQFYRVNLAVVHGGDLFTMGPDEAAFAVHQLIKPRSVIPEHFNQVSTSGGNVVQGTKLERFIQQLKGQASTRVIVPLSDKPISCDGQGNCSQ